MKPRSYFHQFAFRFNNIRNTKVTAISMIAVIGWVISFSASAALITTPSNSTSLEGVSNNAWPFNIGPQGSTTQRYQQIYAASEFSGLSVGGEYITQLAFRPDAGGSAFSATLPTIRIDLSTSAAGPDSLSTTYSNNVGGDNTIVYGGVTGAPLSLSSSFTGVGPKNFDIIITLTTPFFYNPAAGNLLLDVRNFGGGQTTPFDAQHATGDSVSRVFNFNVSSSAEYADSLGLVTQFTTSIPEPSVFGLIGLGLVLIAGRRRHND